MDDGSIVHVSLPGFDELKVTSNATRFDVNSAIERDHNSSGKTVALVPGTRFDSR
jgi:hypothetical protein